MRLLNLLILDCFVLKEHKKMAPFIKQILHDREAKNLVRKSMSPSA